MATRNTGVLSSGAGNRCTEIYIFVQLKFIFENPEVSRAGHATHATTKKTKKNPNCRNTVQTGEGN
jgi:hypothetical protein